MLNSTFALAMRFGVGLTVLQSDCVRYALGFEWVDHAFRRMKIKGTGMLNKTTDLCTIYVEK